MAAARPGPSPASSRASEPECAPRATAAHARQARRSFQTISSARKSLTLVQRRAGDHQVAEWLEEAERVVPIEVIGRLQPERRTARQGVGRDDGTGVVLDAVDAVGVGGQHPHPGLALQRDRAAERELAGTAAAPGAPGAGPHGHRGLAAAQDHAGPCKRLAAAAHCARQRRMHLAHLARFTLDLVAQDVRIEPALARQCRSGLQALQRCGDQVHRVAAKRRIARLRRFEGAAFEPCTRDRRNRDAVPRQDAERVGTSAGIGHRRAAGDDRRVVTRHVADQQRHHTRRRAACCEATRP